MKKITITISILLIAFTVLNSCKENQNGKAKNKIELPYKFKDLGKTYEKEFTVNDETVTRKVQLTGVCIYDRENKIEKFESYTDPSENYIYHYTDTGYWVEIGSQKTEEYSKEEIGDEIIEKNLYSTGTSWTRIYDKETNSIKHENYKAETFETYTDYDYATKKILFERIIEGDTEKTNKYEYNDKGQLIKKIANDGVITTFEYNDNGNLIHQVTTNGDEDFFDDFGNTIGSLIINESGIHEIISKWDEETRTRYFYESFHHYEGSIWRRKYFIQYDEEGRVIRSNDSKEGDIYEYKYDENGKIIYMNDYGRITTYKYDENGNEIYYLSVPNQESIENNSIYYDECWIEYFDDGERKWAQEVSIHDDIPTIHEYKKIGNWKPIVYMKYKDHEIFKEYICDEDGKTIAHYDFTSLDGSLKYKKEHEPSHPEFLNYDKNIENDYEESSQQEPENPLRKTIETFFILP